MRIAAYECHIVEALLYMDLELNLVNDYGHRCEFRYPYAPVSETLGNYVAAVACIELVGYREDIEVSFRRTERCGSGPAEELGEETELRSSVCPIIS